MISDYGFYKKLKAFKEFSELTDNSQFSQVPDSWNVLITDIKGSTKAIQGGRYKDVNLIGAASITCICNVASVSDIPFVFGGDGATILIPNELLSSVTKELKGLQTLSQRDFNLQLRVGVVSMKDLRQAGADLWVGKYELSPGNYTAQFKGGALTVAEDMIKKSKPRPANMIEPTGQDASPQLDGLSCRLEPLQNRHGLILSVLIKPAGDNPNETLKNLLSSLKQILNGDFLSVRPVSSEQLKWTWPPKSLFAEIKTQKQNRSALVQMIQTGLRTLISAMSLSYNIPLGPFKPKTYKSELITNSDFTKFDETLRMVIDCSEPQAAAIEALLNKFKEKQELYFGIHKSAQALMTCMVKSASTNQHIHFIDGADGGYALAAVGLKSQLDSSFNKPL